MKEIDVLQLEASTLLLTLYLHAVSNSKSTLIYDTVTTGPSLHLLCDMGSPQAWCAHWSCPNEALLSYLEFCLGRTYLGLMWFKINNVNYCPTCIPIRGLPSAESTQKIGPFFSPSSFPVLTSLSTPTPGTAGLSSLEVSNKYCMDYHNQTEIFEGYMDRLGYIYSIEFNEHDHTSVQSHK